MIRMTTSLGNIDIELDFDMVDIISGDLSQLVEGMKG